MGQESSYTEEVGDVRSTELRDEIRETRADMDDTLEKLGRRLQPGQILDEVIDYFKGKPTGGPGTGAAGKQMLSSVAFSIRDNPVPAALVGAAIAWTIYDYTSEEQDGDYRIARNDRSAGMGARRQRGYGLHGEGISGGTRDTLNEHQAPGEGFASKVGDKAGELGESVSDAATASWESAKNAGHYMSEQTGMLGDKAMQYAHDGRDQVARTMQRTKETFSEFSDSYPLAVAGSFLAAGVIAGLMVPSTKKEDELMGDLSDQVRQSSVEAASGIAQDVKQQAGEKGLGINALAEKAKNVMSSAASAATEAAKQTAEQEGITPEQIKQSGSEVAGQVARNAKDKVEPGGKTGQSR